MSITIDRSVIAELFQKISGKTGGGGWTGHFECNRGTQTGVNLYTPRGGVVSSPFLLNRLFQGHRDHTHVIFM